MGIKGLSKFLRSKHADLFEQASVSEFAGRAVALDVSAYMYKYKYALAHNWLRGFVGIIAAFARRGVHTNLVFDGAPPPEKLETIRGRKSSRRAAADKLDRLEADLDAFEQTGAPTELLLATNARLIKREHDASLLMSVFGDQYAPETDEPPAVDVGALRAHVAKQRAAAVSVLPADIELLKDLAALAGVPTHQADHEAERVCHALCLPRRRDTGSVPAAFVVTTDTDVLAYGSDMVCDVHAASGTLTIVRAARVRERLGLSREQFVDFCFLCGTDYNDNPPRVGPATALKLVERHGGVAGVPEKYTKAIIGRYGPVVRMFTDMDACAARHAPKLCLRAAEVDLAALAAFARAHRLGATKHMFVPADDPACWPSFHKEEGEGAPQEQDCETEESEDVAPGSVEDPADPYVSENDRALDSAGDDPAECSAEEALDGEAASDSCSRQ